MTVGSRIVLLCIALKCTILVCGSAKKGLVGWGTLFLCNDFKVLNNISWWYDYRPTMDTFSKHYSKVCHQAPGPEIPEFVPMLWRYDNDTVFKFHDTAAYILGFNEPDMQAHADLAPQKAADAWRELERNANGKKLVSPAAAHHNFQWYDEFFHHCNGCRIDYLAAHAYGCDAQYVMQYLEKLYQRYSKEIWLTEFACPHSDDEHQQLHLMRTLLPRLEEAIYIFRYSWFEARIRRVMDGGFIMPAASLLQNLTSTLTRIGHFYNNYQYHPHGSELIG